MPEIVKDTDTYAAGMAEGVGVPLGELPMLKDGVCDGVGVGVCVADVVATAEALGEPDALAEAVATTVAVLRRAENEGELDSELDAADVGDVLVTGVQVRVSVRGPDGV
jgi:hypothetical protein